MKTKRLLTLAAVLCCLTAMLPDALAQNGEMRWFKRYCGREGYNSWIPSNQIIDAKMDSAGNTFVFGTMGYGAHLDGRYICPADSLYGVNIEQGYFLAKIDTAGNVPWIRTTKTGSSPASIDAFLGMTVKNGRVYIAQNEEMLGVYSVWYWFIDTLYRKDIPSGHANNLDSIYDGFPFETPHSLYTRILVFDTAGNLLDHHRIDFANNEWTGVGFGELFSPKEIGTGLIDVDSKGSLYIFTNINTYDEWKPWNQENPLVFRLFNRDTMLEFSTGLEERYTDHYDQINAATLIKIDSSWRHVEFIPLIDSVSGWSRQPLYDSVWIWYLERNLRVTGLPIEFLYNGLTIDKDDNIYLSGNLTAYNQIREDLTGYGDYTLLMDVTAPCKFFFDSVHYLVAEDLGLLQSLPFVLKMDTAGNVLWANQMYTDQDVLDLYKSQSTMENHTLDSDYLYVRLVAQSYNFTRERIHFFTDADHLDTIKLPLTNRHLLYLMYDKTTGECVAHHLLDTNLRSDQTKRNPVNVTGNKVTMAMNRLKGENTFRDLMMEIQHDRGTGEITKSPSTELEEYNLVNMLQHPHGFKFWYGRGGKYSGGDMRIRGGDTVVYLQKNECFMMLYYDSTADCRRPHDTASIDTTGIDTTGIAHIATPATLFTLTPNPTDGKVIVEVKSEELKDKSGEATITLCDATGREVLKQKASTLNSQLSTLNLEALPAGTYFVTVIIGSQSGTRKLVVK